MTTLQSLRKRLNSAKNIKHITQAMEIVAGVRFRKLMTNMEHFRLYASKLSGMLKTLKLAEENSQHPLFVERAVKKTGIIIIAGDKGLCGSFNENIFKAAEKFLKKRKTDNLRLALLGNKAVDYFKKRPWKSFKMIPDLSKHLTEIDVKNLGEDLCKAFEEQSFDELWVVYTKFHNVLSRETTIKKILPLEKPSENTSASSINFIFEPSPKEIYEKIIPYSFYTQLHAILLESYASELSSRIVTMKAATKNAEEMIEKLTLIKNKKRQASITTEILEIIAGAEGLK